MTEIALGTLFVIGLTVVLAAALIFARSRLVPPGGVESIVLLTWRKIAYSCQCVPIGRLKIAPVTGV